MPNMKNAKKRVLVNIKKEEANNKFEATMKTAIKNVEKAIKANDKEKAGADLKIAFTRIDKAVVAKLVHPNKAARLKSRLTKSVNSME